MVDHNKLNVVEEIVNNYEDIEFEETNNKNEEDNNNILQMMIIKMKKFLKIHLIL